MTDQSASAEIDAYLDTLSAEQKKALTHLRQLLKKAAPEAEEIISYAMPGIGQNGALVTWRAFKKHMSFFPMGDAVFIRMSEEIAPWRVSKGTLQFTPENPIPDDLIIKMVKARIAENATRKAKKK